MLTTRRMTAPTNRRRPRAATGRTHSGVLLIAAGAMLALNVWAASGRSRASAPPTSASLVPERAPEPLARSSEQTHPMSGDGLLAHVDASRCDQPDRSGETLQVSQDTFVGDVYVTEGAPASPTLSFGGWGDHYYDYLRFNIADPSVVAGAEQAVLCLYAEQLPPNDPQLEIGVVEEGWHEQGLSISSRPQHRVVGPFGRVAAHWNALDVSELVRAWADGTTANYGIVILPVAVAAANGAFTSSDSEKEDQRPRIYVRVRP